MELPGDRTQWVRSDIRITKKETIRMDGFLWYPNTIDQLLTRTGILRRLRRLRVASAFVLTAGQNQRHCIPLPCLRMELPGDRTQWVRSDIRITKKETIRMDGFFFVFSEHYGSLDYGAFSIILAPRIYNILTNHAKTLWLLRKIGRFTLELCAKTTACFSLFTEIVRQVCAKKGEGGVVRLINGQLWYCCPVCGQKLHKLTPDAICSGVMTFCRRCKWEGVMNIRDRKGA